MTYKQFLNKIRIRKYSILFFQIIIIIGLIFIWEFLSNNNYINSFITSSPSKIIKTIKNLYINKNLFNHIIITLREISISFIITSLLSLIISILFYSNNYIYKIFEPYLIMFNSLPKVALGPIIIIWLGANQKSIIIMSILISLIVSIQTIYNGFKKTDLNKIKLLKSFGANKCDILLNLVIPSNKHIIIDALKINISMCLIGTITGEFLTSKEGIGYLILYGTQVFNLDLVMSGIIILLFLSLVIYTLLNVIIKK